MLAHEDARRTRVVEMDVREDEMVNVLQRQPIGGQPPLQRLDAGRRAAVDDRRLGPFDEVRGDHLPVTEMEEIDEFATRR